MLFNPTGRSVVFTAYSDLSLGVNKKILVCEEVKNNESHSPMIKGGYLNWKEWGGVIVCFGELFIGSAAFYGLVSDRADPRTIY